MAKIFDPLGLITPVTFSGKVFLQELWREGVSWDEPLHAELAKKWCDIVQALSSITTLKIPRYVGIVDDSSCDLFIFCNASIKAYATAIYLRTQSQDDVRVNLVFSKMRLATKGLGAKKKMKEITLPRLELLATTIGIRAANFVTRELQSSVSSLKRTLMTDSTCVLYWLKTNKPLPLFVENRVKEIQKEKDVVCQYVPSDQNPADIPARGMTVAEISQSKLWWSGPEWLKLPQSLWPQWNLPAFALDNLEEIEFKKSTILYEVSSVVGHDQIPDHAAFQTNSVWN